MYQGFRSTGKLHCVVVFERTKCNHHHHRQRTEVLYPGTWRQSPTFLSISWNQTSNERSWHARRRELVATPSRELQISIYVPASFFHIGNYTFTSKSKTVLWIYTFPTITHTDMFVTEPSRRKIIFQFSQLNLHN